MNIKKYISECFRWRDGRQNSGYEKMLLLTAIWPLPFDLYIIRYKEGSVIRPHRDEVESGKHYRLNVIIKSAKAGGIFNCQSTIYESKRVKLFRPDIHEHSVSKIETGSRYVLSLGLVKST